MLFLVIIFVCLSDEFKFQDVNNDVSKDPPISCEVIIPFCDPSKNLCSEKGKSGNFSPTQKTYQKGQTHLINVVLN